MLARIVVVVVVVLSFACGCDGIWPRPETAVAGTKHPATVTLGDPGAVDDSAAAFKPDHVVEVSVTVDPADFAELAAQTRSLVELERPGCADAPFASPFSKFPASVDVDGEHHDGAKIKKRGWLGSLSAVKPALKIDLAKGDTWIGQRSLTLVNSVQDPSLVHTCLSYELFAAAGVPAPRCNFAHVVVNGADLGVYVHVEAIDKHMLARHFDDAGGNLYEGTESDFASGWDKTFDKQTNDSDLTRPEIDSVMAALTASDGALQAALDQVMNVDELLSFWAMESLTADWDGYAWSQNNFFVYGDPSTHKVWLLPWGPDQTMVADANTTFQSVNANGILARRLYLTTDGQNAYLAKVRALLDGVWDKAGLDDEVDRMAALTDPFVSDVDRPFRDDALVQVKSFVDTRHDVINAELANGPPLWNEAYPELVCRPQNGSVDASFTTSFAASPAPQDPSDAVHDGSGTLTGHLNGAALDGAAVTATIARNPNDNGAVVLDIAAHAGGRNFVARASLRARAFVPGGAVILDDEHAALVLYEVNGAATPRGRAYQGTLTITQASTSTGALVAGSLHADLIDAGF